MKPSEDYPRMMFHRTKEPVIVLSREEEDGLGADWSRVVWPQPAAPEPAQEPEPPSERSTESEPEEESAPAVSPTRPARALVKPRAAHSTAHGNRKKTV